MQRHYCRRHVNANAASRARAFGVRRSGGGPAKTAKTAMSQPHGPSVRVGVGKCVINVKDRWPIRLSAFEARCWTTLPQVRLLQSVEVFDREG
jgi:hypothetical protein